MDEQSIRYTIGEVSHLTGLSVHALRWFEREGLIPIEVPRTSGGQRIFDADIVYWITLCTTLRETGMPISGIKAFAELVAAGPGNESDRLALLEAHEQAVRDRIAHLENSLSIIVTKSETYRAHIAAGTARGVWDPIALRAEQ
ncbi:MerR family transcriptional regulator [Arthrobacter sp. RCC_34]|uniref:MerR family transcriptional regulator n=1 Tax=Arthrobacter sp. RCC_34 TaxID=3239230 RepID=UPI003525B40A